MLRSAFRLVSSSSCRSTLSTRHTLPFPRLFSTAAPSSASAATSASTSTPSTSTLPRNTKTSTMLTGLPVVPNASEVLVSLYKRTIEEATQYGLQIHYNQHIVRLCEYRLKVVQSAKTVEEYESIINTGCAEELIEQAEDELDLLKTMNETVKPWELDPENDLEIRGAPEPFGVLPEHWVKFDDDTPSTPATPATAATPAATAAAPTKPSSPDTPASPQTKQTKTNP